MCPIDDAYFMEKIYIVIYNTVYMSEKCYRWTQKSTAGKMQEIFKIYFTDNYCDLNHQ